MDDCVQRTNIQNLKAIHNLISYWCVRPIIVFKERIYKIWKQFTTCPPCCRSCRWLCSKNEYTKSESNSQLSKVQNFNSLDCVQRTNIQNLKAIHNCRHVWLDRRGLCSKNEYTKSESNSQLVYLVVLTCKHCVQRTNIQNLKAIHNSAFLFKGYEGIVFKERIYKIWKQFTTGLTSSKPRPSLCSKNEYTKSESNSQRIWSLLRWR